MSLFTHKLSPVEQAEIVILCRELFVTMECELPDLQPKKDTALAAELCLQREQPSYAILNTYP